MKIKIYTKEKVYNFKTLFGKNYNYALNHAYRENGPSYVEYNKNNQITLENWIINKKLHNKNGPAFISYFENGNIKRKAWYKNNKLHREDGPALFNYFKDSKINYKNYYLNNKKYNKIDFNRQILKKKIQLF